MLSGHLDIFYPPNFGGFDQKATFSTPTGVYTNYGSMSVIGMFHHLKTVVYPMGFR